MRNAQKQPTTRCRAFDQYNSTPGSALVALQQAEALKRYELGQNWQLLLTLRVPQQHANADKTLLAAVACWVKLCERRLQQRLLRSVYLHKRESGYHAHIYVKYPLGYNGDGSYEVLLRESWFAVPALRGHSSSDLNYAHLFHCQPRHQLKPGWGAYGLKGNTGAEAWIDDLSVPHHSWGKAMKAGQRLCASAGEPEIASVASLADFLALRSSTYNRKARPERSVLAAQIADDTISYLAAGRTITLLSANAAAAR